MIQYKSEDEIELIRKSNSLVSHALAEVAARLKPGVKPSFLDTIAEETIRDMGGVPGFKGYGGFPATLCFSKNEAVVHGIPGDEEIKEEDILSIDCGAILNEFYGDCAYTFILSGASQEAIDLCIATQKSLYLGIAEVKVGNRIGDIGYAIQTYTEKECGYSVVRDLVGHGVGRNLHEEPQVPNFGRRGRGTILKEGLVIAIEPMINMGKKEVVKAADDWTILTRDKKPSAHYEHSVALNKNGVDILSTHELLENEIKKNANIIDISEKK